MKTAVILNPRAGGGRALRRWREAAPVLAARFGRLEVRQTEAPGHAGALAAEFLAAGYHRLIAAGGDGTAGETAAAFAGPVPDGACLGVLPLGTSSDFARALGLPRSPRRAAGILATAAPVPIDLGRAIYRDRAGIPAQRCFLNVASFGLGGAIVAAQPAGRYLLRALRTLRSFRPQPVRLALDGRPVPLEAPVTHVAIGNGKSHGGGILICPEACLTDGLLEVTTVLGIGPLELLRAVPLLYSGRIHLHPKVRHFRAACLTAEADLPLPVEIDGEPAGTLPLEITVLFRTVPLLVPSD